MALFSLFGYIAFAMKFLIYVRGNPNYNGHVRMRFRWVPQHGLYLLDGKETEAKDFDKAFKDVFESEIYREMFPLVKIAPGTASETAELTLDKALDLVEKLAPHRLKKQPGPKVREQVLAHA